MTINLLLVAIGGFFGATVRYSVTRSLTKNFTGRFPHATLFVNLLGSYVFGACIGFQISTSVNLLFGVGFLGAFTTFSTLKLELVKLKNEKNWVFFTNYFVLTYLFGISLAFAGVMSASLIMELKTHLQYIAFMLK